MTDQQQTDAMAAIMGKLNSAVDNKNSFKKDRSKNHSDPTSMAAQTDAMADVLRKFKTATSDSVTDLVNESRHDQELDMAINTTRTHNGVTVSKFDIVTERKDMGNGLAKTFYNVIDNDTGEKVYSNLALFESAMGLVKHELYTNNYQKIQRLVSLDQEYVGLVLELLSYKQKLKTLTEDTVKFDVTSAKYSNVKEKLKIAKKKILQNF